MSWKCFEVWSVIRFLFSIILASHRFLTNVLSADQSPTRSLISREALKSPSLSRCLLGSSERWFKRLTFPSRRMILPFREQLDCNFRPQSALLRSIGSPPSTQPKAIAWTSLSEQCLIVWRSDFELRYYFFWICNDSLLAVFWWAFPADWLCFDLSRKALSTSSDMRSTLPSPSSQGEVNLWPLRGFHAKSGQIQVSYQLYG